MLSRRIVTSLPGKAAARAGAILAVSLSFSVCAAFGCSPRGRPCVGNSCGARYECVANVCGLAGKDPVPEASDRLALEPAAPAFTQVVVAEIVSAERHPQADKLQVCRVSTGQGGELLQESVGGAIDDEKARHDERRVEPQDAKSKARNRTDAHAQTRGDQQDTDQGL